METFKSFLSFLFGLVLFFVTFFAVVSNPWLLVPFSIIWLALNV